MATMEYKELSKYESWGAQNIGIKVLVAIDREFTREDERAVRKFRDDLESSILKESLRLDPVTHEKAALLCAEIVALFPAPIFVEEIPNGYCSRYCCAFKPWFVVTTEIGRIKIGWRKSVLHLEWTDSAVKATANDIFPKEEAWPGYETTQYDKVIHAHSYDAAARYIQRIIAAGKVV